MLNLRLICGCLLSVAWAQAPDPYLQLVRMYRTDPSPATVSMARLSPDEIGASSRRCQRICARADLLAGAMLHLDVAELVMAPNSEASLVHIRAGQLLLQAAPDKGMFARRWHAVAARLFLAHGHAVAAAAILTEGRTRYKEAPELFVVLGLITEWRAGVVGIGGSATDLRGAAIRDSTFDLSLGSTDPGRATYRGSVLRDLEMAAAEYRRGLAAEPAHAGARIRLAWVHLLAGDARVWEDVSTEFLETADTEAQLIARLIRGTAAERERKFAVALAEYREAWRVDAGSQTACLAVSSGQAVNGDFAGADRTAAECLTLGDDPDHVDQWTLFRMGLMDTTTTRWLHDEARRP